MRWWKWAAGAIGIAALGAFAALWALTEADVLRWGASGAMHDRIEALEKQASRTEQEPAGEQFIVVNADFRRNADLPPPLWDVCITYSAAGGVQEQCKLIRYDDDGEIAEETQPTHDCWFSAVIGEPLPSCWRRWFP